MDSPKGNVPVSTVSLVPPPPPPKNAARMLALALAESAQQATILSQKQSSGPPTPVSPLRPQELLETLDWPLPSSLPSQLSEEETAVEASNKSVSLSSPPLTPTEKITRSVSLHLSTADSGKPSSISCNSQDVISPETPSQSAMPSCLTSQVSQTQRSPERQQPAVGQTPVSTSKTTTKTITSTISSKDAVIQQPTSEVSNSNRSSVSPKKSIKCKCL